MVLRRRDRHGSGPVRELSVRAATLWCGVALALTLAPSCHRRSLEVSAPTAVRGTEANAGPRPLVNTLEEVSRSAPSWTHAVIIDGDDRHELSATEVRRLAALVVDCEPSDGWSATTPPWPSVVVEARDVDGPRAVFQLQAMGLRVDPGAPYAPSLASMHDDSLPKTQDCTLSEENHTWAWELHERLLGSPRTKEYSTPAPGLFD